MRNRSIFKNIVLGFIGFLIAVTAVSVIVFYSEIRTVVSIKKLDNYGFYAMDYCGDYGFDEFLQVGASNNDELINFVTARLAKGVPIEIDIKEPDLGCTTFNAVTPAGEYIFGRNFDMNYAPGMIVHTKPANGYESISMVNLAFLGYRKGLMPDNLWNSFYALGAPYAPLDGLNEKGLAVGILLVPDKPTNQQTEKIDITCTAAIRLLLDKASTVEEAVALLKKYDMHDAAGACYHYQIADADGNSAIVEYIDNEMHVLRPEGKYQVCTNFFQTPGRKFNFGEGQDRYRIVMAGLKDKKGIVTEKEGMNLLQAARMVNAYDKKAKIIYSTQWSAVYNNTKKTVTICVGRKYDRKYKFALGREGEQ